jgi:MFS family permease
VVGFAAGAALLLINLHGSEESSQFVSHGEAALWMILLALQPAFWAAVTSYAWKMARHYLPRRRQDLERIAASAAVIFVLVIGQPVAYRLAEGRVNPLWGWSWKLPALTAAGFFLVGLPSLLGILGVQAFAARNLGASIQDFDIERFVELRDDLNRFLALLGATIGLAVLATGALRNAVLASNPGAHPPAEIILEYGGFLTLLLAFAYAPANYTLIRLGLRIRDVLLPERPPPKDPGFGEWYATRKNLTELLQVEIGTFQRLQTGVLILSPLLSAALSLAIPKAS